LETVIKLIMLVFSLQTSPDAECEMPTEDPNNLEKHNWFLTM